MFRPSCVQPNGYPEEHTMETTTNTLKVPGATLYYEVRGAGPVLLLICGGIYDAAGYAGLANQLADRYTVVTYDRRGNSRSPLDGPPERQRIEVHADDAHRILTAVGVTGNEPADVFGNSSGAVIGLELAARHPEQVRTLVAHEPPVFGLLPDSEHWRSVIRQVEDACRTGGPGAAMEAFSTGMEMGRGSQPEPAQDQGSEQAAEPDAETLAMMGRMGKNMDFFIAYEVPPFAEFTPDLEGLKASRVVLAAGDASVGEAPHRAAFAVAERLGTQPELFPGDHGGFGTQSEAFAARLREVLSWLG
jgi:pimeloyl-ACP methyl ester carboxylesterase